MNQTPFLLFSCWILVGCGVTVKVVRRSTAGILIEPEVFGTPIAECTLNPPAESEIVSICVTSIWTYSQIDRSRATSSRCFPNPQA
jgi:hypothetical protein